MSNLLSGLQFFFTIVQKSIIIGSEPALPADLQTSGLLAYDHFVIEG